MSMILDQTGTTVIDTQGYPRYYVAFDESAEVRPYGLFMDCYGDDVDVIILGSYADLTTAQQALRAIYSGASNGVSISLEGVGVEKEESGA